MKRPSYKTMYLNEKAEKEIYKDTLNVVIDELKKFESIEVIDEIHNSSRSFNKIRYVKIKQNDKYFVIALNLDMLEDEVE